MIIGRRGFIGGLIGLVAAPAIIKIDNLMPVSVWNPVPKGPFIALFTGDPLNGGVEVSGGGYARIPIKRAAFHEGMFVNALFPAARQDWSDVTHLVADGRVIPLETPKIITKNTILVLTDDASMGGRGQGARTYGAARPPAYSSL